MSNPTFCMTILRGAGDGVFFGIVGNATMLESRRFGAREASLDDCRRIFKFSLAALCFCGGGSLFGTRTVCRCDAGDIEIDVGFAALMDCFPCKTILASSDCEATRIVCRWDVGGDEIDARFVPSMVLFFVETLLSSCG